MGAFYYELAPRYTPGSPAAVDEATARRVAKEEKDAYTCTLEGIYGEAAKAVALEKGLALIAFEMCEKASGWVIHDLITDEWWWWPFTATCPKCKATRVKCRRGTLEQHYMKPKKGDYQFYDCKPLQFVGKKLTEEYQQNFRFNGR